MKRLLFSLCAFFLAAGLFAQAPSGFKFQAVARDVDNNAMATENIAVRVSLLKGGPSGSVSYSERHEVTTTDLGVFDLHIGNGVSLSGDMSTIDWGADNYYLKVDMDPNGGTSYVNLGASQLLSVPYAMYATSAGSGGGGGDPTDELQNLIYDPSSQTLTLTDGNSVTLQVGSGGGTDDQTISLSGTTLSIEGGNAVDLSALQDGVNDADADPTNEIQNLSFNPATNELSIDGGNTITIPSGGTDADADPMNEIQTITISGDQLSLSNGGGTVTIPSGGGGNTDEQTLSFNPATNELTITGGNTVTIPTGGTDADADPTNEIQDISFNPATNELSITNGSTITIPTGGADADADPMNELQTISKAGNIVTLSDGGGTFTDETEDADADPANEIQDISFNPATNELSITNGSTITIPTGGADADADPMNELQTISKAGDIVTLSNGGGTFTDETEDADADPTNEIQTISKAGDVVTLSNGGGTFTDEKEDADADPTNEIQMLSLSGTTLSLSDGGGSVNLPAGGSSFELPYYGGVSHSGGAFHAHNNTTGGSYGVVGTTGTDGSTIPANRAGVLGYSTEAHGVYGRSENSFYAGVQGVSNSATGVGVQGYGFGGGVGGHFYTTTTGVAALTTGRGNVGIGIDEPDEKMHVGGNLFVQTNLGNLQLGFPNDGARWALSTIGSGATLQFRSKLSGATSYSTRFRMMQDGEFQLGTSTDPSAWMHIRANSSITKPQLKLEESGNDYARLELTNDAAGGAYWHLAGLPSATTSSARLNFYFRNASGAADRMTITGDGEVGINGSPTARLELFQRSQTVGSGLRFDDGTANSDWDVTHGFGLRFHYGGSLRGLINANTGAYTQSSDARLKTAVAAITPVMDKLRSLSVKTYQYKSAEKPETTIGLLAQEAKDLFPELVSYSEADQLYGINYAGFSMVAIKAIQEQQQVIDEQETEINDLKARLARLEALLLPQADRE
ncbi:tail fiber domain-containing protein [Neolewinella agarilytica]|uniref:Chaperone of endosialidase n=1 Tax=Neolewinella agarilytica TaxID=478744 RepID=A0A1H9JGW9_9BACT|nr:tail fiber domain-containing protein [Neolewinella agarilytica]SEQ86092.1 Chaperone of endosialidase [Neolewinella agarilytica]